MILAKSIIVPFLMALFISVICAQPVYWLEKRKVPRALAVMIVLIGIISIFFGFGYLIGNTLSSFASNASEYQSKLKSLSDNFIQFLNNNGIAVTRDQFPALFDPSRILTFTVKAINELVSMMGNAFLVFLTVLFLLLELGSISHKIRAVLKGPAESLSYLTKIIDSIRRYLGIKAILGIIVSILLYIALSAIGLDYAILWALIAGLMSFIPHIGAIIAAIPTLLFALLQLGTAGAVWTLISFTVVSSVFANFIEPKVMGRGLSLSTLVVFLSLIFWNFVLGIVGMFLSVPLTITLKIILEQNERTKWIAILLGTTKEAKIHLASHKKET
jgi:predicted PurR-regulated permease PerM